MDVGQGKDLPINHKLTLPQHMICGPGVSDLTRAIYPNIANGQALTNQYFLEHAILCSRNDKVDEINSLMCGLFPGESRTYSSADSIQGATDGA